MLGRHNAVASNPSRSTWSQRLAGHRLCIVVLVVLAFAASACTNRAETTARPDGATPTVPELSPTTTLQSRRLTVTEPLPPPLEIFVGDVRTEINAHSFCWTQRVGDGGHSICADGIRDPARTVIEVNRIAPRVQWLPAEVRVVIRKAADSIVLYEGPLNEGGALPIPLQRGTYDVDAHGRGDAGSASFLFRVRVS